MTYLLNVFTVSLKDNYSFTINSKTLETVLT